MRRVIVALAVFVCMAISAQASQPFIALVDLEKQVLWIPEGTAVPAGVEFYLEPDEDVVAEGDRTRRSQVDESTAGGSAAATSGRRRLVYAYAPEEKFAGLRERTAASIRKWKLESQVDDHDVYYYYYFYDGSYHAARKYIRNVSPTWQYAVQYGTDSVVHDIGGNYDTKATAARTSTQYSSLNASNTCWFYGSAGTCSIPLHVVQTTPTYTGSVTSKGTLVRYLYGPCDTCKEILNSSIVISFP